jgi:hypothetical protein
MTSLVLASLTGSLLLPVAMGERMCALLHQGHTVRSASRATVTHFWPTLSTLSHDDLMTISGLAGRSAAEQCPGAGGQ